MRAVALLALLALPSAAAAVPTTDGLPPEALAPQPVAPPDPAAQPAPVEPAPAADNARRQRYTTTRPVGFGWGDGKTSKGSTPIKTPAVGAPYNLTHIALGALVMLAMLGFTLWLVRRTRGRTVTRG